VWYLRGDMMSSTVMGLGRQCQIRAGARSEPVRRAAYCKEAGLIGSDAMA
jgi:hypothetical protein